MFGKGPLPNIVLCAGLHRSGSTWLFNVVTQLLTRRKSERSESVRAFFADSVDDFPDDPAKWLVVKSHIPQTSLVLLARAVAPRVIITVRDPRDSVVSLMERFQFTYESAMEKITRSAAALIKLADCSEYRLLRYEDMSFEDAGIIADLALFIGIDVSSDETRATSASLTRERVREKIAALEADGVFGRNPTALDFDDNTHWHPGHVGDGKVGKYTEGLTFEQQAEILIELGPFCKYFGYEHDIPRGLLAEYGGNWRSRVAYGQKIEFKSGTDCARFLASGWSQPETRFVWSLGVVSRLHLTLPPKIDARPMTIKMRVGPFVVKDARPDQRLVVLANGRRVLKAILTSETELSLEIPPDLPAGNSLLRLVLIHPDRARPCDLFERRPDNRQLALRLISLEVSA